MSSEHSEKGETPERKKKSRKEKTEEGLHIFPPFSAF